MLRLPQKFPPKLRTLAIICLFTSLAGILFELIKEEKLDYNSILLGLPLGLIFCFFELFLFPLANRRFRRWSFSRIFLFKSCLYTASIYLVTVAATIIMGLYQGHQWSELPDLVLSFERFVMVLYTLAVFSVLVFFLQVNYLLGEGVLWKFIRGKYHHPREEERIFMFLDMKSSTSIAERLGHVHFYTFLNELFHEISQPVLQTNAEIYQYVGDEIVITWKVEEGLYDGNCLNCFFLFRDRLISNEQMYLQNFGVKPEFKAGLHYGKVISGQIGDLKKEIVYNGDVLNTTSRIQSQCNKYHQDFLVSGALVNRLKHLNGFQWERLDTIMLRGKETEVELFGVSKNYLVKSAVEIKKQTPIININTTDHDY
ncbi:MAG: adenylate/guanylate cyclase domain-containing protein [Flavisolibacter sp.]